MYTKGLSQAQQLDSEFEQLDCILSQLTRYMGAIEESVQKNTNTWGILKQSSPIEKDL